MTMPLVAIGTFFRSLTDVLNICIAVHANYSLTTTTYFASPSIFILSINMIRTARFAIAVLVPFFLLPCCVINAEVVDLTGFSHGQQIISGSNLGPFVQVSSSGANQGLAIFDTNQAGTVDSDLEVDRGNALIFQNNNSPNISGGVFTTPNDDPDGGVFTFNFLTPFTVESIDLIDIDNGAAVTVTLTSGGNQRVYQVPQDWTGQNDSTQGWDTLDLTTSFSQPGLGTGGSATFSEDAGFDPTGVTLMTVTLTGSGAINNIRLVPEPGSFTLFATACLGLLYRRRSN